MASADWDTGSAESDVCIVGAGPVGLALAFKLEELGLAVTLVEMGAADLSHAADSIEFANSHHAPLAAMSRPGVGGTSALWGGRCVAFDDLDFDRRAHVPFSGWPIPHDALRRHYPEAFGFLKCNAGEPELEDLGIADHTVATDALERWSRHPDLGPLYGERLQASSHIRLVSGMVTRIVLDPSGRDVRYLEVNRDGQVSKVAARTFVLAGGGLENARLLLALQQDRAIPGEPDGPLGRFYQGHLTGYIAVLQFDRPNMARHFAFQVDDDGYVFRRRLQISPPVQAEEQLLNCVFWIDTISIADPVHGSGALSLIYLSLKAVGLYRRLSKGLAPTARGTGNIDRRGHWGNLRRDRRWVPDLVLALRNLLERRGNRRHTLVNPRGRYLLRYHAEQVPNPESRVTLQPKGNDGTGRALAVDYRVVEQDLGSVMKSHEILDRWLRRSGLGRLEYLHDGPARRQAVFNQAFDGYHQIGLSRMSETAAEGIADADCRVHGIANLYLAGSCLFPTGGHANPTLPAVALALRLAGHLKDVLGGVPKA